MAKTVPAFTLTLDHARRVAIAAQGLTSPQDGDCASTVEATGFVRTLGGADVYLAIRARRPGTSRAEIDGAVEGGELKVVPAARGCIYLVPRRHVPAALRFAQARTRGRAEREHQRAGIRPGELDEVSAAVLEILAARGALTTTALRAALPDGTVRSLGAAGKKVGISSTLPPALRRLEFAGEIERTLEGGRLDTERYLWRVPVANPFAGSATPESPSELNARLAEVFFRAAGLATLKQFAPWAGITQRDAKAALEHLSLLPLAIEEQPESYLVLEEYRELLADPEAAVGSAAALLPFEDNLVALHGGPALAVDPRHHGIEVPPWGRGKGATLGDVKHSSLRTVVAGNEIVGFWEFDPDEQEVVYGCFQRLSLDLRVLLDATAAGASRFLAEEIGHGHSFSLDTDDSLRKRAAIVRRYQST